MPHQFRAQSGQIRRASAEPIELRRADGTELTGIWGGSSQNEKLAWWLQKEGWFLTETRDEVAAIAVRDEDTGEIRWGGAPGGAHLLFVAQPETRGKDGRPYRIVQLVTRAAAPDEMAYFNDTRSALFARLNADGSRTIIPPLPAPPPEPPAQGELF